VVTDSQDREVWRWDSTPFGLGKPDEDPDGDGRRLSLNLRFPGQYYDKETGLHYNGWRYYKPRAGRYLRADPIGLKGGLNYRIYANSNPMRFADISGMYCLTSKEINALAGGIGGVFSGALSGAILASPTGPGATVGAISVGMLGGVFGAAFGYFSTSAEGNQIAAGISNAAVTGINSIIASIYSGAVTGALSSTLQSRGVRDTHAGIISAGIGGSISGGISGFIGPTAPESIAAAIAFSFNSALKGGLAGLSGAALSAAITEALRAGDDCDCQK